jgi:hypothetical protein
MKNENNDDIKKLVKHVLELFLLKSIKIISVNLKKVLVLMVLI